MREHYVVVINLNKGEIIYKEGFNSNTDAYKEYENVIKDWKKIAHILKKKGSRLLVHRIYDHHIMNATICESGTIIKQF